MKPKSLLSSAVRIDTSALISLVSKYLKFTNLGDNHYQINHNLTYSTKAAINRANPADSRIWIDAQWWPFECELIPNEIIDLKVAELNQEEEERKSENIF